MDLFYYLGYLGCTQKKAIQFIENPKKNIMEFACSPTIGFIMLLLSAAEDGHGLLAVRGIARRCYEDPT